MSSSGQTIGQASYARAISKSITYNNQYGKIAPPVARNSIRKKYQKEKKMGWFKRKFAQWAREAWESADATEVAVKSYESVSAKSSIRFTVYPASGGFVIEHYKQDRYKDGDGPTLTIVNHGEEVGKAVEHIIALEALRS